MCFFIRESFGGVAWFGSYETICRHFINRRQHISTTGTITKKDLNPGELMGAGAVAGILFNSALFPADVIKARQQIVSNGRANGFVKEAIGLYKSEGVKGFFRGYGITAAKAGIKIDYFCCHFWQFLIGILQDLLLL